MIEIWGGNVLKMLMTYNTIVIFFFKVNDHNIISMEITKIRRKYSISKYNEKYLEIGLEIQHSKAIFLPDFVPIYAHIYYYRHNATHIYTDKLISFLV